MSKTVTITLNINTEMTNKEMQEVIYQNIKKMGIEIDYYRCQIN